MTCTACNLIAVLTLVPTQTVLDMLVNSSLINVTITEAIIIFFCQGLCYKEVCYIRV